MNKRLVTLIIWIAYVMMAPLPAFAQVPTPTYGWNLGNTLEAIPNEGAWGPPASQNLINGAAAAGFNTVRIPCAWDTHADQTTHQIDPTYMARVKQVVDWCYGKNLYVIVNCHWDGGWFESNISDTVDSTINAKMNSYWTQIANTFENYDGHLLFAGANEPAVSTSAQMSTLLTYYQTFINAVRATGGNNGSRWLVIQGPSTDIDTTDRLMNSLPNDPTPGRLAVEVHYYSPFQWCLMSQDASWGNMFYFWGQTYHSFTLPSRNATLGEESYLDAEFQKMQNKFVNNGIPVIVGEFQAIKRVGYPDLTGADFALHVASRTYFHKYVVDSANGKGLKPIYWDTPGGTMDWNTGAVSDADNKRALTGGAALPPLAIVTQSAGQVVVAGGNATFTVTATEASPLTYRWQRQAAGTSPWINLTDNSTYSGSTTASLTVASITAVMNGDSFQCIVTGGGASVTTSPAMLVVNMPMAAVTLAGQAGVSGQVDGAGSAARFSSPADVAFDAAGNLYVADTGNHTVRKIDKTGTVSTFAGQAGVGGSTDGSTSARFNRPSGLAVGATGNVYVADTDNSTIRMISTAGVVTTLVGCAGAAGSSDGTGTAAGFSGPSGIAVAATGDLYVSDTLNDTIRMVTSAGVVTTIAGVAGASGLLDGVGSAARFHGPQGLVLDSNGNLFVADTNNNAIRRIVLASGTVTTVAGQSGAAGDEDGAVTRAQFHFPSGIGVDAAGNLYIADTDNNALRQIAPSGAVNTPAGLAGSSGSVDGVGTAARFFLPTGVTVSAAGDVYMADTNNHTIRLAVIPSPPAITTQPQSQTVAAGSSAQFSVTASGRPAVTYQWNFNGTPINGATSSSFSLSSAQSGNAGSYTVVVSNVMGNVTSTFVTLTVSQNTPPTTIPQGGGGGGGGGAPSDWFYCALLLMVVTRICQRRPKVDRPADIEPK